MTERMTSDTQRSEYVLVPREPTPDMLTTVGTIEGWNEAASRHAVCDRLDEMAVHEKGAGAGFIKVPARELNELTKAANQLRAALTAPVDHPEVVGPSTAYQRAEERLCTCGAAGSGEGHTEWCEWQSSEWRKWGDAFNGAILRPPGSPALEAGVAEAAKRKFDLWFFRDMSDEQRLALFSIFGMPVDEIGKVHGHQRRALKHILRALSIPATERGGNG